MKELTNCIWHFTINDSDLPEKSDDNVIDKHYEPDFDNKES